MKSFDAPFREEAGPPSTWSKGLSYAKVSEETFKYTFKGEKEPS
jgi:hypothetical protein